MKKITYVLRPYIHKSGRVMVRVRWNHSKVETVFSIGCSADPEKWSKETNRAKINTTHNVNGVTCSAKEINSPTSPMTSGLRLLWLLAKMLTRSVSSSNLF